jgi:hypothetical protein
LGRNQRFTVRGFGRKPSLQTALAYEAIFDAPVKELFAGLYQEAERMTAGRTQLLRKRLEKKTGCQIAKLNSPWCK